MQVSLVPVPNVDQFWPHLREGFERALLKTGGYLTTGDLWAQCRAGTAFLIVAHEGEAIRGASIWQPDTWMTGRKMRCLGLYGVARNDWLFDMRDLAARLAKDCGATSLVSEGRPGWQKIFPKAKVLRVLYEEPL
jgi:hypothetical protein